MANFPLVTKKVTIAGAFFVLTIILFVVVSGCIEATEGGGEAAAKASDEASSISVPVGAIPAVANSANTVANLNNGEQSETPQNPNEISIYDETDTIPYHHLESYLLAGDQGYQFDISIASDGDPVVVLFMDHTTFSTYQTDLKQGSPFDYSSVPEAYTNIRSQQFSYSLPTQGRYYLAIVNGPILDNNPDTSLVIPPVHVHVQVGLIR
jgi:hypothetical protein